MAQGLELAGISVVTGEVGVIRCDATSVTGDITLHHMNLALRSPAPIVSLNQAQVQGRLIVSDCSLTNQSGPVIEAKRMVAAEGVIVQTSELMATSGTAVSLGESELRSLRVGPSVEVRSEDSCAVDMSESTIHREVSLDKIRATGGDWKGAIRITESRLGLYLRIANGSEIKNPNGPALSADGLVASGRIQIEDSEIEGHGDRGAVRIIDAQLSNQFSISDVCLQNTSGPCLMADSTSIKLELLFSNSSFTNSGRYPTISLRSARVDGALVLERSRAVNREYRHGIWELDGLIYRGTPTGPSTTEWLDTLRNGTVAYSAHAYKQFAAGLTAAGHDSDARRVLILQQWDRIKRGESRWSAKVWGRFVGVTLGFGYQSWRALVLLAIVVSCTGAFFCFSSVGTDGLVTNTSTMKPCSSLDRFLVGVGTSLPLVRVTTTSSCDFRPNNADGRALAVLAPVAQSAGWALSTLFVAGFTGIIRRP